MRSLGDEFKEEQRVADLQKACVDLQRKLAKAKQRTDDLVEAVERAAYEASIVLGRAEPINPPKRKQAGNSETALLHLTDWQLGKHSESYDSDVCVARVESVIRKTIRLAEIQRAAHPVSECVVMLGGDMVENVTTFPGQAWEVDSTMFSQLFRASGLIESSLLALLAEFDSVRVFEVAGNHGRIGGKRDGVPRGDNLDRILYRIARERLADQSRLEWVEPSGWYEIVNIGEYRALLVHGDQIKSFGGNTPAFGISRKAIAWSSGVTEPFDDLYLGHFHQVMQLTMANGGRVFMTPSTESGSEYAREFVGAKGKPGQRLHFVDPLAGRVTAEYVIWCD